MSDAPECPDCGSRAAPETDRITDPAATYRQTTVTYCPDCGEVLSAAP
jgi:ribosomal protein S27AE